jgi:branched-chain amino acid transport system substrate-binding protein
MAADDRTLYTRQDLERLINPRRIAVVGGDGGAIREDGRVIRDMGYFEVKSPSQSRYPRDYYHLLHTVPADQIYRPLSESECPLVRERLEQ